MNKKKLELIKRAREARWKTKWEERKERWGKGKPLEKLEKKKRVIEESVEKPEVIEEEIVKEEVEEEKLTEEAKEEEIEEEKAEEEKEEEPAEEAKEEKTEGQPKAVDKPEEEKSEEEEKVAKLGMKFCSGCGEEIRENWTFHKCGWKEKKEEPEEETEERPKEPTEKELEAIEEKIKRGLKKEQPEAAAEEQPEEEIKEEEIAKEKISEEKEKIEESKPEEEKEAKPAEKLGKYVYCLIPKTKERISFGNIGIENNSEVYTMNFGKIVAVVSDAPFKDYQKSEDNIKVHDEVVRRVMEKFTVLPMSFSMVFKNEKILRAVLKKSRSEIKKALKAIDGKVEMGLKVLKSGAQFDEDAFAEDIKIFRKLAVSASLGNKFSKKLVLNVSYLVAKDLLDKFSEEVKKIKEKYSQLKILYTGPWAPYNFVSINIGGG